MESSTLNWSLVIATYKRDHILPRCINMAIHQTTPPVEIVIIDASPNWFETKNKIIDLIKELDCHISLRYEQANEASITVQRNQGIDLAKGDILFLIDDDSLMYNDCAEEIMKIYQDDVDEKILGISAMQCPIPPDNIDIEENTIISTPKSTSENKVRELFKKILNTQKTQFLPYDAEFPYREIPSNLNHLNIGAIRFMTGSTMTFRRSVFLKERFSTILYRYCAGEDQDLSYRVSRHGILVNAINAKICHLEISGGRLTQFQVTVLAALNPAVLQQFYSSEPDLINVLWKRILLKRVIINFLKDASELKFSFMRTRGVIYALFKLSNIHNRDGDDLALWYKDFQKKLIEQ